MNAIETEVMGLLQSHPEPMGTAALFPLCTAAESNLDVSRALYQLRTSGMIRVVDTLPSVGRGSAQRLYAPVSGAVPPQDGRLGPRTKPVAAEPVGGHAALDPFEVVNPPFAPAQAPAPKPKPAKPAQRTKPAQQAPVVTHAAPCPPPWPGALDISASLEDAATAATDAMLAYADAMLTEDPRWWALRKLQRAATSARQELGGRD